MTQTRTARISWWLVRILFLTSALSGCYSTSLMQDARLLPPRRVRAAIGAGYATGLEGQDGPQFEAQLRVGISKGLELQGKVANAGAVAGAAKLGLAERARWRSSLLAGAQAAHVAQTIRSEGEFQQRGVLGFNVTPLFGLMPNRHLEVVLAPDLQFGTRDLPRWSSWAGVGARLGLAVHMGRRATIMPECSTLLVALGQGVAKEDDRTADTVFTRGDLRTQCGVSVGFGSSYTD